MKKAIGKPKKPKSPKLQTPWSPLHAQRDVFIQSACSFFLHCSRFCPLSQKLIQHGTTPKQAKARKVDGIFFWLLSLTTIYIRDVLSDTLSLAGNHFCVYLISVHQCPVHWLWRNQRDILTRRHHPNLSAAFESFQRELGAWRVHLQASRSQAG